jgi:hypothetical protein
MAWIFPDGTSRILLASIKKLAQFYTLLADCCPLTETRNGLYLSLGLKRKTAFTVTCHKNGSVFLQQLSDISQQENGLVEDG